MVRRKKKQSSSSTSEYSTSESRRSFEDKQELRRLKSEASSSLKLLKSVEKSRKPGFMLAISAVEEVASKKEKTFTKRKEAIERKERVKKRFKSLADKAISGELKFLLILYKTSSQNSLE